ncbi:hypothetical protein [Micromonospora sp. NPDC049240]|uniref:hypothetical protein n=1 Tax=Micromonospora sp. NPDC049240 TaxID=3155151 RepID=UPI0033D61191
MTFTFAKPSAGEFFKPAEHMNDLALLIEPKSIRKNVPHTYQGVSSVRDELTADITVFRTEESLDKAQPSRVIKGATIAHKYLVADLEAAIGQVFLGVVTKKPFKNGGSGFVWKSVDPSTEAKAANYFTNREAAISAALDDAPDFD